MQCKQCVRVYYLVSGFLLNLKNLLSLIQCVRRLLRKLDTSSVSEQTDIQTSFQMLKILNLGYTWFITNGFTGFMRVTP